MFSSFFDACQSVENEKVTKRKAAAKLLREEFSNELICRQLDDGGSTAIKVTWESLFSSLQKYVLIELEHIVKLERDSKSVSNQARSARNQAKDDVAETMRAFVRAAKSRSCKALKIKDVLRHMIKLFKHSTFSPLIMKPYSYMLLHELLPCSQYTLDISHSQWTDLFDIYFAKFKSPLPLSHDDVARIISCLITCSSIQYDVDICKLYVFFENAMKLTMKNQSSVMEVLLTALNNFCGISAPDARGRLCRIGEELIVSLAHIWSKSGLPMKKRITEFFWIQVTIHHPKGCHTEDNGSWAHDNDKWMKCIDTMYNLTITELQNTATHLFKMTSNSDGLISPLFVDLSVNLMHQVFKSDSVVNGEPSSKRRRMAESWSVLIDNLSSSKSSTLTNWLQVTSHMLTKWPQELTCSDICCLLSELNRMLKDDLVCRNEECVHWLLICLKNVAVSIHSTMNELKEIWKTIWDTCLRLKLCRRDSRALLTIMAEKCLIEIHVDKEPWKLALSGQPTKSLVSFIAALLAHHNLPESFHPLDTTEYITSCPVTQQHPLRSSLLQFLLFSNQDSHDTPKMVQRPQVSLMSHILVALTQQSVNSFQYVKQPIDLWITSNYQCQLEPICQFWSSIETLYLCSSLNVHPLENCTTDEKIKQYNKTNNTIMITPLYELLCQLLEKRSELLLQSNSDRDDVLSINIESVVYHFTLIISIASLLNTYNVKYNVICGLKDLLQYVITGLKNSLWNETNINYHYELLIHITEMLIPLIQQSKKDQVIKDLLCSYFTSEFLTIVHQLALHKYEVVHVNESDTTPGSDDFETMEYSSSKESHSPVSTSSSLFSSTSYVHKNLFDSSILTERSLAQKTACEFLVHWYLADMDRVYNDVVSGNINGNINESWTIIRKLLTDEKIDLTSSKALQIIFHICKFLVIGCKDQNLDDVIMAILNIIRRISQLNKRNQEVYRHSLQLLSKLSDSIKTDEQMELYLSILGGFRKIYNDSSLTANVRCIFVDILAKAFVFLPVGSVITAKESSLNIDTILVHMIPDSHHCVRLKIASILPNLFSKSHPDLSTASRHDKLFIDITKQLEQVNKVKANLDPVSSEDESVNRISSILCILQTMACSSVLCERHVISSMICDVGLKKLDDSLVIKAVDNIAKHLGFPCSKSFLEEMVGYLMITWLKEGPIEQFPYTVFENSSLKTFLREYSHLIIPYILWSSDHHIIQSICNLSDISLSQILQQCLPVSMVFIVVSMAIEDNNEHAKSCFDYISSNLTMELLEESMNKKLSDIVVELLIRLYVQYDSNSSLSKYMSSNDLCNFSPYYTSETVHTALNYLPSCYQLSDLSFIALVAKKKDVIQSILLSLNLKLYSTHRLFRKKYILLSYQLFVRHFCQELKTDLHGLLPYVVMDVIYSMIRVIDCHTTCQLSVIFPVVCDTLQCLLKAILKDCPQALDDYYHILFNKFLPFARTDTIEGTKALNLLMYLTKHGNHHSLLSHVAVLDPLPNTQVYDEMNKAVKSLIMSNEPSLNEVLSWFSSISEPLISSEGLEYIHDLLARGIPKVSSSLIKMDVYLKSSLLDFLLSLITLSKKILVSESRHIITKISRCLGDIGYTEIPCIALPEKSTLYERSINQLFSVLARLLTDKDILVVKEAGNCLKSLFSSGQGINIFDDTDTKLNILEPFKLKRKASDHIWPTSSGGIISWTSAACHLSEFSHPKWLTNVVLNLLNSDYVNNKALVLLSPVCKVKIDLCEWAFPLIIHDVLANGRSECTTKISNEVVNLLTDFNLNPNITVTVSSVITVLDMIMYLRTKQRNIQSSVWENNFWLKLDFLEVSKAACTCSLYFVALLYLEIWYNDQLSKAYDMEAHGEYPFDPIEANPSVKHQLLNVFDNIGEPDSVYGAIVLYSPHEELRKRLYEHQGHWDKALNVYNWQLLNNSSSTNHSHLVQTFKNLGLPHVLEMYIEGVKSSYSSNVDNSLREYQYESAWKYKTTYNWSSDHMSSSDHTHFLEFHSNVSRCLYAINQNEKGLFEDCLYLSRLNVMKELCYSSNQSVCQLQPYLTKLQCLEELEAFGAASFKNSFDAVFELLFSWKNRLSLMGTDFQHIHLVLSMRGACVDSLLKKNQEITDNHSKLYTEWYDIVGTTARLAREAGNFQIAEASFFMLTNMLAEVNDTCIFKSSLVYKGHLEEAELCWARGEHTLALMLMDKLVNMIKNDEDPIYPLSLCQYGDWLAKTKSHNPVVILDDYLQKAVELMESQNSQHIVQGYFTLARFADSQYNILTRQMESKRYETKRELLKKSKIDLEKIKGIRNTNVQRHVRQLKVHSNEDELVIEQQISNQKHFLKIALNNYIKCLQSGTEHDLRIFRVCSLLFSNSDDKVTINNIEDKLCSLPSMKFLPLIYQLAARMSYNTNNAFQQVLQKLLFHISADHPHHSLYVILALSNASLDNEFSDAGYVTGTRGCSPPTGKRKRKSVSGTSSKNVKTVDEDKVKAAKELICRLQSVHPVLIKDISQLCDAYVDLAYHDVTAFKLEKKPIKLPSTCPLLKIQEGHVAMPTIETPIDPTCQYNDIVTIKKFDGCISLCGGVNLPKVISCLGSDGKRRRQLIKGKDDLRQDAVMQQVFCLVNKLLMKEPFTAKSKLSVKTYKVIPLSQCSGVVEWCEGTLPIGQYLIGTVENPSTGAHNRYRPQDWTNKNCRAKFAVLQSKHDKQETYEKICKHFKPVFHHFFMEQYLSSPLWFERRLAYTRNVAASSIVGYIVGLGDRHIQNILIDKQTAELIHIDLGVAFEQGKTLPTPELIPFRLTRDIIDGMGVTGVDGVFKRCCEKTMTVMRSSHEELRTIVEVLLHDPLVVWNISTHKIKTLQGTEAVSANNDSVVSSSSTNQLAERVLIRLQEKLEGVEDGTLLSVEGQVSHLIQEATDPMNLGQLFHGWQPWV